MSCWPLRLALLLVLASGAAISVGCGSSDHSATRTATPAAVSKAGVAEAKDIVAAARSLRPDYLDKALPKLGRTPPKDKTVFIATCTIPVCAVTNDAAAKAAVALGWTVKRFSFGITPEDYTKTWDQMLSDPQRPDYIVSDVIVPNSGLAQELQRADQMGIKTVQVSPASPTDRPGSNGVVSIVVTVDQYCERGKLAAALALAEAGGATHAVATIDPEFPGSQVPAAQCMAEELQRLSPESKVDLLKISLSAPPEANQQTVVNYLQRDPDVKYVFMNIAAHAPNLRQALDAAGMNDVKIVIGAPVAADIAALKRGDYLAAIQDEESSNGWRAIDALARLSVGEGVGPERFPTGYMRIVSPEDAGSVELATGIPVTPGEPQAFLRAWGVGG